MAKKSKKKRGRPPLFDRALTNAERQERWRSRHFGGAEEIAALKAELARLRAKLKKKPREQ